MSFFSTKLGNISWKKKILEGNTTLGHKCNIKRLNLTKHSQQMAIVSYSSQLKNQGLAKSSFTTHHPFQKVLL